VFHKGRELYGLFEARQAEHRLERVLIVEGYMDVVALAQFGIRNAVATLGTATSEDHLRRLFRLVGEVVFCFDGDRAGRQAATRALEAVLPLMIDGRQARFLFLPEGEDPDTLIRREGADAFQDRVTCASPLSEFLFDQASAGRDLQQIEERERYASQVLSALGKLPEGVLKSLMLGELSRRTGVNQSRFEALLAPETVTGETGRGPGDADPVASLRLKQVGKQVGKKGASSPGVAGSLSLSARALQLLLHEPSLVGRLPEGEEWCPLDDSDGLLRREVLRLLRAGRYRSAQVLLAHFHGTPEGERLAELARRELLMPREGRGVELDGLVEHFLRHQRRRSPREEIDALLEREKSGDRLSRQDRERLMVLLTELRG
jgi:DNA primase